eukprot:TRINITY_DN950_c0_g1_i2.p1 TRINITY_DN950_c0_g1~~TRINITY_DN950_c0_g1_i2.p1  ORF type:complete len:264 (+),score=27.56 TRINITY_DN950_c0_g1_i2:88-879(+)
MCIRDRIKSIWARIAYSTWLDLDSGTHSVSSTTSLTNDTVTTIMKVCARSSTSLIAAACGTAVWHASLHTNALARSAVGNGSVGILVLELDGQGVHLLLVEHLLDGSQQAALLGSVIRGAHMSSANHNIVHEPPCVELVHAVHAIQSPELAVDLSEVDLVRHRLVQGVNGLGHDWDGRAENNQHNDQREGWVQIISPLCVHQVHNQSLSDDEEGAQHVSHKVKVQLPDVDVVAHTSSGERFLVLVILIDLLVALAGASTKSAP